jgi:hypothetical protein
VVVDREVGHAADGCGRGDEVGRVVRDSPPRRVSSVGGAGDPDPAGSRDACPDERLYPGSDVLLLPAAPAVLLDGLLERQPEPGTAAVVRCEHVEAPRDEVLDLGVEPVLGVARRAAVYQHHRPHALPRSPVQPPLHLQPVHRTPPEVLSRHQPLRADGRPLR